MKRSKIDPSTLALSRRSLLRLMGMSAGAGLLAACAGGAAPAAPQSEAAASEAPAAGEPREGGTYRILFGDEVPNLDAAIAFSWADFWSSYFLLYNRLYTYDQDGNFVPELAADVPEVSEDGLVYTIPLRTDVKFHNGETMTAEDVKFTFDRTFDPTLKSPAAGFNTNIVGGDEVAQGLADEVSGVKVIDDHTIEITLKQKQSVFPAILTVTLNGIVPKKAVEEAGADWGFKTVIGTGPFKLVEWQPGEKIVFARHEDYFKDGLPYLDGVELYTNVENEQRVLRWESGEAEYADGPPGAELIRIQSDPELAPLVRNFSSPIFDFIAIADTAEELSDVRVRQAIAMALDKQTLADTYGIDAAQPLDGIYTPGLPMYNSDFVSDYRYDPEAAKALMAEAGFGDGIQGIRMFVGNGNEERGQILQADLKEIGIDVELAVGDFSIYRDQVESGEIQLRLAGYGPDFPDAYPFVTDRFSCEKDPPPPPAQFCNDETQSLITQSNELLPSDPARNELFHRIQEIVVNEEVYIVPLYNRNLLGLGQDYVQNDPIYYYLPALEQAWIEQ